MNGLRASELAPEWRRSFSHFITTEGWEVLPPILRSKPLAVVTTAKRLAPCLDGKPSQLPDLGSWQIKSRVGTSRRFENSSLKRLLLDSCDQSARSA